jgi:hypothetical protein
MGIMPVDRELKWQRVFRRFGLPGELPGKDPHAENSDRRGKEEAPAPPKEMRKPNHKAE